MSDHPTGPWQYKGMVMDPNKLSSGNHPGVIDYKGNSYVFGFTYQLNRTLTDVHRERRSVSVARFTYNPDGTIPDVPWFDPKGVPQVGTLDPYKRNEAETIAWEFGVRTSQNNSGVYVTQTHDGSYIKVAGVDFAKQSPSVFSAKVASPVEGTRIDLHLDGISGPLIGSLAVAPTGSWWIWNTQQTRVSSLSGVHDLYFVFRGDAGKELLNFDLGNSRESESPVPLDRAGARASRSRRFRAEAGRVHALVGKLERRERARIRCHHTCEMLLPESVILEAQGV